MKMSTDNIFMWRNTAKQCRLGLFQDTDFAGDLEDPKSSSGRVLSYSSCAKLHQEYNVLTVFFFFGIKELYTALPDTA